MKKQLIPCLLALVLLFLSACGGAPDPVLPKDGEAPAKEVELPAQSPDGGAASSDTVEVPDREEGPKDGEAPEAPPDTEESVPEEPLDREGVFLRFASAMTALEEQVRLDVSGMTWQFGPENDLKNIYYAVLKEYPELKYTYDLEASVSGDTAECTFWYMPYKTGAYDGGLPAGSHTVGSLHDARVMAQSMNGGTESLDVAITDPTLEVDDIQAALSQAGYGWIKYTLSRDGTQIVATPPVGRTLEECSEAINESFRLGGEVLAQVVTEDMTDREKAQALYHYLVSSVGYDFRYYSDRENMPYESTVALGALRDGLAICGGYAQALETLLDMAGIENYTVSGISRGAHPMWNYVVLEGQGYYCDPTADRGGMNGHFLLSRDELEALGGYSWERAYFDSTP